MNVMTDAKCLPQSEHNNYLMQVVIASFFNDFRGFLENSNLHWVSFLSPVLLGFFKSTYFYSFSLSSESILFVSYILDLGFSPCWFWSSAPAPLTVFARLSHRLFIFTCSLLVDSSFSQKPCLLSCNIRGRVFFFPQFLQGILFLPEVPIFEVFLFIFSDSWEAVHIQPWLTAPHTKDRSPRGFTALLCKGLYHGWVSFLK